MSFNWRALVGLDGPNAFKDSTGLGPDFPGSAGDRERGKFRASAHPRLTQIAVVGDEGNPIAQDTNALLMEVVHELTLLRHALVLGGLAADIDEPIK